MFASSGWSSLSTNADTYSVNVPMPDTIGRPGGLMLSRLASIMMLSGFELLQVDTTRLVSLWTFGIVQNVAGRRWERISLKTSLCKLGCSSLMRSFSLFVNVGVGSLSIFS